MNKFSKIIAVLLILVMLCPALVGCAKTGWQKGDEGTKYLIGGEAVVGINEIEGKSYFFDQNGFLLYGLIKSEGKIYFADSEGALQRGWQETEGQKYYFLENFEGANGLITVEGEVYCFKEAKPASGLVLDGGKLYYGDQNGKLISGTFTVDGISATFGDQGLTSSGIFTVDGAKYYFKNGVMQFDWQIVNKKRYFFGGDGKMLTNTEIGIYEIDANGVAKQAKAKPSNLEYYIQMYFDEYGTDEKGLFNAIKNNCTYKSADISIAAKETYEETACDAINQGHGVCWHLASLAYCVYKQAGYEVYYVRGNGLTYEYHEWIYVKFEDGNYYHVDPSNWAGYKNTDAKMIERGYHTWEIYGFEG